MGAAPIQPITLFTPVPRWWAAWLVVSWKLADRSRFIKRPLLGLRFIHVARWGLVWRVRGQGRLPTPYLVFQSNFDGAAPAYIEAFSITVPWRLRGMLGGAYTFPGPRPINAFVDWVFHEASPGPTHYYAAYPEQTVRTIGAALDLEPAFRELRDDVRGRSAAESLQRWSGFLTRRQRDL